LSSASDICVNYNRQEIHEIRRIQCAFRNEQSNRDADKSLARPGMKLANISVKMVWISFGTLPRRKKKTCWQLTSQCCWNRACPWHASEFVSFLVGLRTYRHPGKSHTCIIRWWIIMKEKYQKYDTCYKVTNRFWAPKLMLEASSQLRKIDISNQLRTDFWPQRGYKNLIIVL